MVDAYLKGGRRMFVKQNSVIYEQGTSGAGFYVLVEGKVKISMKVFDKKERILEIQGNGQLFGEHSMDQNSYFCSAITLEDSIIYYFTYKQFQELVIKNEMIRSMFYSSMIDKLKQLGDIIQLKSHSVEEQLASSLLEISSKYNSFEIPLNQRQLSNYTGLTRITIYKIMKEWEESNLLTKKEGKIFIKNPEFLREYVSAF